MKKDMQPHRPGMGRREWLKRSGASLASAFGATSLPGLMLAPQVAHAADYKALVCVFLFGGNDGLNTITPMDAARYQQYAAVRGPLALPQGNLVPLTGSSYGLHPAMSPLASVWTDNALAPVFNVGPLLRPTSKAEFRAAAPGSSLIPDSLFSHSDQQLLWAASATKANNRTGWGGRAASVLATTNPVISVGGNGHFGLSIHRIPLTVPGPGGNFGLDGLTPADVANPVTATRKTALDRMYAEVQSNQMLEAYSRQQRQAFADSARLAPLLKTQPGHANASQALNQAFAPLISNGQLTTGLAAQLYQIAKMIEGRATVQGDRQIFYASLGGFDTHSNQVGSSATNGSHAALLGQLAAAMAAFYQAMKNIGMSDEVTLFTQSDFGRNFKPNSTRGTDHAWGNNHLVMGGAVRGGTTYGRYPELVLGGADDIGEAEWERQGRWIPTLGVDQYASTLLQWFGAAEPHLSTILPNLYHFSQKSIGFMG